MDKYEFIAGSLKDFSHAAKTRNVLGEHIAIITQNEPLSKRGIGGQMYEH